LLEVCGIGADPDQNGGEEANNPCFLGKCRRISGHAQPQRITAHFIRHRNFRRKNRGAAERRGARQRSGRGDLSLTDAFGNSSDPGVIDAPRSVIKNDVDGRAELYSLESVL
jgi:hypothetical protein